MAMKPPPAFPEEFVRTVLNTTPEALQALYEERRPFEERAPEVGAMAPDFSLAPLGGGPVVRLASFRDRSPVALIFGSFT
jgi:hypothetical protein